jgi:hypothetical protein
MTLRIVNDNERPDNTLYCRWSSCAVSSRPNPATMLMDLNGTGRLPACDDCARRYYEMRPDLVTFAPLSEYVDMFAAAKEAALATPEQITGQRVIPCFSCDKNPADVGVVCDEDKTWQPACNACFRDWQARGGQATTRPLDEAMRAAYWQFAEPESAASRQQGRAPQQDHAGPWYTNPDVVSAAVVGGVAIAAHEASKRRKARLRDSVLGIAPLNNVAAGARQALRIQQRQGTTDPQEAALQEQRWLNDQRPRWVR